MILVLGSGADSVYPQLISSIAATGEEYLVVDEEHPDRYNVLVEREDERPLFRIVGDGVDGTTPVGAIFVRHSHTGSVRGARLHDLAYLQMVLNRMLRSAECCVVNPPANGYSNYSKPHQVRLLAEAGFDVPRSLVTNIASEALRFWEECDRDVIFKGVSNVLTLVQKLTPDNIHRLDLLPNCPTLLQERVPGSDYRVHVVGDEAFVTEIVSRNEDYRRGLRTDPSGVTVRPATLPAEVIACCIAITRQLGLVVSGIDLRGDAAGRLAALELNPFPQFTFYEGRSGQQITGAIADYLVDRQSTQTNVFA